MNDSTLYTIIFTSAFLLLFGLGEFLYHVIKVKAEITRKLVHVVTGFITLLFPLYLDNHWYVLFLCNSFLLLLLVSKRFNFLPSINRVSRFTVGSLLYPAAVYFCYLGFAYGGNLIYFFLPILILAICDPLAALTGKLWPIGKIRAFNMVKSISGFASFFMVATLISVGHFWYFLKTPLMTSLPLSLAVGIIGAVAEIVSHKGYDNITIPMSIMALLYLFNV